MTQSKLLDFKTSEAPKKMLGNHRSGNQIIDS